MNGLDLFSSLSATGISAEDDDWGEFVDSSPRIDSLPPNPNRIESVNKGQAQWVASRGPVPLSVFGEEEDAQGDQSGSFDFSFGSFSAKHNDATRSVDANPTLGIGGLVANLYRENELPNGLNSSEMNGNHSRLETLNWNPLNLDTESTSNAVNSSTTCPDLSFADKNDDDDDGWEFKTAESADGGYKQEEHKNSKSGSVVIQNTTSIGPSVWSSPSNGTTPNFDAIKSDEENGDHDPWANGGWEFKVAEAREPPKDLTNKESNGWGFEFGFEHVTEIETTTSFQSNLEKESQKIENGIILFPNNATVNSGGASWAFTEPSSENGKEKEEREVQIDKPKGALPLSFFEDELLETSDTSVHKDNLVSDFDFSVREKTKDPSPTVSINDLISSLYSQVEGKNAVNLSEQSKEYGFVSVEAATDSNLENGEEDSWEFQGPTNTTTESSIGKCANDVDSSWEFQGRSLAMQNSDVAEGVDEFENDSWEFQGPTQPVKDSTSKKGGLWESEHGSVGNEVGYQFSSPDGFGELLEKPVISIAPNDYQDVFHKLKTELYYISLNHLETLKEARNLAADSDEVAGVQNYDGEIQDMENWLNNDVLISEVNLESLQARSSGITELSKALREPKFRALDSEDLLSERLLIAEKDWKTAIELFKYATLTLKILNLGSLEQQLKYASTWFVIASACAQELQHAASTWKQVIKNDVQDEILSKPKGKNYALSVGEIYRVVKILEAATRLYKPWILLGPTSSNVLPVLEECVKLWLSSGLEEAMLNNFGCQGPDRDYSVEQLLESIKCIDKVEAFKLYTCITSATSPTCYISGVSTEIVPGIRTVEWKGEHYLVPIVNLWANLISRDPPSLLGHRFPTLS